MKNTLKYTFLSALFLGVVACDVDNTLPEIKGEAENTTTLVAGTADFSNYVALGASFTAGFTDNALFKAGQENSFPNILAKKFAMVGGGTFTQPLMNDNFGGLILAGNPVLDPATNQRLFNERLIFNGTGPAALNSVIPSAMSTTDFALNNPMGPFKNLGVPGALSTHFVAPGYGNLANFPAAANPYAIRVAGNTNSSLLELFVAQAPTFFTLSEFGGNDVLGYATSGGDGTKPITPTPVFEAVLGNVETALKATGAKGVIANLPYITSLPHFTTIPYNAVPLDAATATALNQGYAAYNGGIQGALAALSASGAFTAEEAAKRTINFSAGQNAMVIIDESLTDLGAINPAFAGLPKYRQATAADLFVLPLSSLIPQGYGTQTALEDKWVLTPEEQAEIKTAVDAYNAKLKAVADANGYAFVDLNAVLQQAATTGLKFDTYNLTTSLVTGGLVSLDGIHLTGRGYALMANKMLEAIDATYGSNFAAGKDGLAKADSYPTNYSPTLP
ncbi:MULTISPECIES: SGNH/GDSL hydrolase family protein [unclassified Tenacibaculum]|uniref:SGNH/GDSL hydrolase family protein n=1 Tax=unclassified Tenacibaculum TaxID=2635139 RepID=UPI001F2F6F66|nr:MULTISPECIES: G-D-S-L family lipolytic protein [unclassified Tenacibaculum]MCF2876062.1 G-D-S-L family lipolytic protein [Tenacibaculum sp. Cn5-1]MCF2936137.1 G-D-S-L family lipolytic protein [Tenacibaculum sp. Cn5-34]MCG7512698.1 G-D-S-L family lipolytic protein [Tenacibaculum sp. Cn5-46]